MNSSIHVFGNLGNGYTQFPDDYAKDIFQAFFSKAKASSQIIVHRNNDLMYYGYIRKLDIYPQYIGFCVLFNGVLFPNMEQLFGIFEKAVTDLVVNGVILQFNEKGEIISKVNNLFDKHHEIERISNAISSELEKVCESTRKLPPVSYGTSIDDSKTFLFSERESTIIDASCRYSYISILKDDNYETSTLSGYKSILQRQNEKLKDITQKYEEQKSKNAAIIRQKKQIQKVVLLLIAVSALAIISFLLNKNLNTTKNELNEANDTIISKEKLLDIAKRDIISKDSVISLRDKSIKNLKEKINREQKLRQESEDRYELLKTAVTTFQPIIVKSTGFSFSTGRYEIKYYGLASGSYPFTFRVILPDGNKEEFKKTIYVSLDDNTEIVTLSNKYNSSKFYAIEIMYNGRVIGGSRH